MAREDRRHRGPNPCRPLQRLHNTQEITAPLDRTHSTYARPPTPQETTTCIRRATKRKAPPVHQRSVSRTVQRAPSTHLLSTMTLGKLKHKTGVGGEPQSARAPRDLKSADHNYAAWQRRQARKESAKPSVCATIPCPHYPRLFRARIGLTSHLRTHLANQTPPPRR